MKNKFNLPQMMEVVTYPFAIVAASLTSVGINANFLMILSTLMAIDFLVGFLRAWLIPELDDPTSKRAILGLVKKGVILILIGVLALVFSVVSLEAMPYMVNTLIAVFAVAEGYSILANIYCIYTGEVLTEFDAVTLIIKSVGKYLEKLIKKLLSVFEYGQKNKGD